MARNISKSVVSNKSAHAASVIRSAVDRFEELETRRMFSTLTINGTSLADTISLSQSATQINVTLNGTTTHYTAANYTDIKVVGNAGDDLITASSSVTKKMFVFGDAGNDTLQPGSANDAVYGGDGSDLLKASSGGDVFWGGTGSDTVDYSARTSGVIVSLDDAVNDGATGENDNVHTDVENINGGSGNDYLQGNASANAISGNAGNDTIYSNAGYDVVGGGAGNDYISNTTGNDYITGSTGNDTVYGGSDNPTIDGGADDDYIAGGSGAGYSYLYGSGGNDTIRPYGAYNVVYGGDGNDDINSYGTNTTWEYGGAGNDTLYGGYGQNVLYGEAGDDTVKGYGTQWNWLYGGEGNDIVKGSKTYGAVWNSINGDAGNDSLFGGQGNDNLYGGEGDDTLVSIGGGDADTLSGGNGFDSFWADSAATEVVQSGDGFWDLLFEGAAGNVHRVGSFYRGVSKELLGQNLADPTDSGTTVNLSSRPLFASTGPSKNDIDQGGIGDCGTMATLSAIAKTNPNKIRQSVVDLGDGTYATQFFSGGTPCYVRVDGDMITYGAGDGAQSSIWVRVMEKAFATFRSNTFASVASRWMSDVMTDLGATSITSTWSWSSGTDLLNKIADELAAGKAVTVSTDASGITGGASLVGNHAYMVERVNYSSFTLFGVTYTYASSVTLRNPWGSDGAGNDGNNDGYVTITAAQANENFTTVMAGNV